MQMPCTILRSYVILKASEMDLFPVHTRSKVYQSFEMIDHTSHQTVIRFFEDHEQEIRSLDFDEYFDILVTYVHALFQAGAYQKHVQMANVVIEASMINNLNVYQGINLFEKTLFQKAASLYHLHRYKDSIHILTELIKINPLDPSYRAFLVRNEIQHKPRYFQSIQGLAIALFLTTILLIGLHTFYIEPFQPDHLDLTLRLRNSCFFGALGILVGSDGLHRIHAFWRVDQLVRRSKEKIKRSQ
jgi:tetratricopeptide (TPR) repeat protein